MLTAGGARGAPFLARQPCFRSGVFRQSAGSRLSELRYGWSHARISDN
jgi:hypothetical protein